MRLQTLQRCGETRTGQPCDKHGHDGVIRGFGSEISAYKNDRNQTGKSCVTSISTRERSKRGRFVLDKSGLIWYKIGTLDKWARRETTGPIFFGSGIQVGVCPLIEDPDIERAALHMIMVHGILAEAAARKRAHTLTRDGQANAAQLWQQIADAIAELMKP